MSDAARVTIAGRGLVCRHCGHDRFEQTAGGVDRTTTGVVRLS
jgi:hypothetical protein